MILSNTAPIKKKILFENQDIKVLNILDKTITQTQDIIVCIPYLIEKASILLRYTEEPAFLAINPNIDKYVTALNIYLEENETLNEAIINGIKNSFGIELKEFEPVIQQTMFLSSKSCTTYHICILPLMNHNFEQIQPEESKKLQMKNSNIIFQTNELNNLIIYDILTKYSLDVFKQKYI